MTAIALGMLIVVSLAAGVWRWPQAVYPRSRRPAPGLWLLVIAAVAVIDQVLVSIYVLRAHHGDAGFITAYVGPAWFHVERSPVLTGGCAAVATALLTSGYAEMRLLWGAAAGLLVGITLCILADRFRRPSSTV